jgi:phospholipid/cholesterol/gamma-HCH transport system substrate-binding protein
VEPIDKPNFEIRVGLFTVIALIILSWGWAWLKNFSWHTPQTFTVKFHDVAGLNKNAPVNVNGVRVGTVEKIELKGKGQVYCGLKISSEDTVIPQGSAVTIQTQGLVGAKYLEITLPEVKPNEPGPPPIDSSEVIIGQEPVRTELYINKIVTNISNFTDSIASSGALSGVTTAAENSGQAVETIRDAARKFSRSMDKLSDATTTIRDSAEKFGKGSGSADVFFNQGTQTLKKVSGLTDDLHVTSRKVNKVLENPNFTSDFKDTAKLAKETAEKVQNAIHELNTTLTDQSVRTDLIGMLNKLANSTENICQSMKIVQNVSADKDLRNDMRELLQNAKEAMAKANILLGEGSFVNDAKSTMAKLRTTSDNVDTAAKDISTVLERKHLLLHMMFGSGTKKAAKMKIEDNNDGSATVQIEPLEDKHGAIKSEATTEK